MLLFTGIAIKIIYCIGFAVNCDRLQMKICYGLNNTKLYGLKFSHTTVSFLTIKDYLSK